jgi:hypothetical protein
MDIVFIVALIVTSALTFAGVLSNYLDDNLVQRVGLSLVGLASTVRLWDVIQEARSFDLDPISMTFVLGVSIYGISTMYKLIKSRSIDG